MFKADPFITDPFITDPFVTDNVDIGPRAYARGWG